MSCNETKTITFDEKVKGWTSFHSYVPDFMIGMNNQFYSFKNGDLYLHDSDNVTRNNFYGVEYSSKISAMISDSPSEIKEIQAISLEGNHAWDTLISAYISNVDDATLSSIKEVEFVKKEGIWYAYARRNEDVKHIDSKSTYGIGIVTEINGTEVLVNGYNSSLSVGDKIMKSDLSIIGEIVSHDSINGLRLVLSDATLLTEGDFIIGVKDARIEGGNLRGYTMRVDLETYHPDKVELFAVNAEVIKSYS